MGRVSETLGTDGWPQGYIGAADPTRVGPTGFPRGLNTALALAGTGIPYVQKRQGMAVINRTPISGTPSLIGNYDFHRIVNDTDYHLLVGDDGSLSYRDALNAITTVSATAFTAGTRYPDFATANDLCFIVNGTDRLKYDGTALSNFGIERPTVGSMAGAAGVVGLHNGTYELRVSYGNSVTGTESGASNTAAATVTVTNDAIDWTNIPTSADTQVDRRYLYVRNIATQTQFYRVGTITNNTATTATTSVADANATVAAQPPADNRPPTGARYLAWHQGRLFVATSTNLYWSKLNQPEMFEPLSVDGVNKADGQPLTGLTSVSETLAIFKEDRVYGLFNGNDPVTWQIRLVDSTRGCASHRTLVLSDGTLYWWHRSGLCRLGGAGVVEPLGERLYGDVADSVNYNNIATASGCAMPDQSRILMAVPSTGQDRATRIIPFHTQAGAFEATYWDLMDAASLGTAVDGAGRALAWLANYEGQLFQLWSTNVDGVPEGTLTGNWVATAASVSAFTSLLDNSNDPAVCDTTGAALVERYFGILDSDGNFVGSVRRRITANTADSITVNTAIDGFAIGTTYTWVLAGPDFQFDTPWRTYELPWIKKRYEYFHLLTKGLNYEDAATITLAFDYDDANSNSRERTLETLGSSGLWDSAIWDQDVWDIAANTQRRFRVARVGFSWRARISNAIPNQPVAILSLGMDAVTQTGKR